MSNKKGDEVRATMICGDYAIGVNVVYTDDYGSVNVCLQPYIGWEKPSTTCITVSESFFDKMLTSNSEIVNLPRKSSTLGWDTIEDLGAYLFVDKIELTYSISSEHIDVQPWYNDAPLKFKGVSKWFRQYRFIFNGVDIAKELTVASKVAVFKILNCESCDNRVKLITDLGHLPELNDYINEVLGPNQENILFLINSVDAVYEKGSFIIPTIVGKFDPNGSRIILKETVTGKEIVSGLTSVNGDNVGWSKVNNKDDIGVKMPDYFIKFLITVFNGNKYSKLLVKIAYLHCLNSRGNFWFDYVIGNENIVDLQAAIEYGIKEIAERNIPAHERRRRIDEGAKEIRRNNRSIRVFNNNRCNCVRRDERNSINLENVADYLDELEIDLLTGRELKKLNSGLSAVNRRMANFIEDLDNGED